MRMIYNEASKLKINFLIELSDDLRYEIVSAKQEGKKKGRKPPKKTTTKWYFSCHNVTQMGNNSKHIPDSGKNEWFSLAPPQDLLLVVCNESGNAKKHR